MYKYFKLAIKVHKCVCAAGRQTEEIRNVECICVRKLLSGYTYLILLCLTFQNVEHLHLLWLLVGFKRLDV